MAKEDFTRTKIIMLGGRRSGKSTILSTVIHTLNDGASHLCTFNDATPYGASSGMQVSLIDKRREIDSYLRKRGKFGKNSQFIVDMSPSLNQGDYNIVASVKGASKIGLDFVDVPGEWMESEHQTTSGLLDHVKESDVFIVAIDTPYLMQDENPNINSVWNRTDEITNLLSEMKINADEDKKLVIFVPVKCEKWAQENRMDEVTQRVKESYKTFINSWVDNKAVEIWVMPILTVGGLTHTSLLDAYRFFKTEKDKIGEICSIEPLTGILRLKDGKTLFESSVHSVESDPDKSYCISYTQIPLSWYKCESDEGFNPRFCEQVAYHILRFLVEKETILSQQKYEKYRDEPWWKRIFSSGGRFGKYLPIYRELIKSIPIKSSGDGFTRVTEVVDARNNT